MFHFRWFTFSAENGKVIFCRPLIYITATAFTAEYASERILKIG